MNLRLQGFVLAGGRSRRMGSDKARLDLAGQPLLLRILNLLRPHVESVTVLGSAGTYDFFTDPVIPDRKPGRGPLVAILTGLEHSRADWSIFLACDMPLLSSRFIELLLQLMAKSDADAVVPQTGSGWKPVCAAYRKTAIPQIREAIIASEYSVFRTLQRLRLDVITSSGLATAGIAKNIFENVNRPEDWQRILDLASTRVR